jgi:hypothetical protein
MGHGRRHGLLEATDESVRFTGIAKRWTRMGIALGLFAAVAAVGGCALTSGANNGTVSPSLAISTPSLPQGQLQSQYQASLSATGGKEPYTWTVLSGTLPSGLSLTSSTGTISGTPTQSGTSTFTVGVEDASSPIATARAPMTISIGSSLQVSTGNLPSGTVRQSYSADLSATGGTAPYKWSISSGQLPLGLALSSAGAISGVPSTVGQKSFTVEVTDSSSPATTAKAALAIDVVNATSTLEILTSSLPSGTVRASYEASLSASGGTAPYKWSVSSGELPAGLALGSSGTITGVPTTTSQTSFVVQVSDSSSPAQTAKATMNISVAATQTVTHLQISDVAPPSGIAQISYVANLSVTGGTAPYRWSIISGQLPGGLTLSGAGEITGIPTTTGQSTFAVEVMDSSVPQQTATQNFEITIAAQSESSSGPYTSRTDHDLIPLPVPLPSVGGSTGAGRCISQPGYNNLICRATDLDTLGATNTDVLDQEFSTCCGGWADINVWNVNSTMFFVSTNGGGLVVMSFDPTTHAVAPLYGQPLLSFGGGWWSYSNPQLAYALENGTKDPVIVSMTITSQTTPPQPVVIADLAKVPNCVPALAGATEWEELAVSRDEQTFVVGAGTGTQGSGIYVIVYNLSNGCRWFNTQTRQIGGNWGVTGTAATPDNYAIHSVRVSEDGQTVIVTPAAGAGTGTAYRHFWNIDSLTVTTGSGNATNGHFATGYSGYVNNANETADNSWCKLGMAYRTFADLNNPLYVLPTSAQCGDIDLNGDDHSSWSNDDTSDDQPFFTSTVTSPLGAPIISAWQNEVLGFSIINPGTVWRFMSTYSTGTSPFFTCQNGIGSVSQDGKWFIFTSDWGNTLGIDGAGNNRCDVFVGQLK